MFIAGYPREYDRWAGAIAPLLVFSARPQEQPTQVLHLDLDQVKLPGKTPRERLYVGAGDGRPLPSQLSASRRFLSFVVDLPARGARTLNIMATTLEGPDGVSSGPPSGPAPAEPPTDLTVQSTNLGTGEGKVTVSTGHYTLTLDEAHGGTVTQFESARTGRDYATGTCGAAYGSWGHYPPDVPRTNTVEYIGEEHKVRQDQAPGRLEVLAAGPVEAIVKASWSDGKIKATQEYHFFAHQPWFAVTAVVHPGRLGDVDEIIAFDFRLQRHELSKTYPNFVGIVNALGQEQPHFGWRETDFIPPVATAMTPDKFEESVSLIVNDAEGCDRWRQGIWPETRPQAGPAKYCWIEIGATRIRPARVTCHVFLHEGHQTVAQRLADELKQPPLLIVPRKFKWRPGIIQPEEVARPTG